MFLRVRILRDLVRVAFIWVGGQWQEYSKNSEQCRAFWLAA